MPATNLVMFRGMDPKTLHRKTAEKVFSGSRRKTSRFHCLFRDPVVSGHAQV
jgi:hypothetical protein